MKRLILPLFMLSFTLAPTVYGADDMSKYHRDAAPLTTHQVRDMFIDMLSLGAKKDPALVNFLKEEIGLTGKIAHKLLIYAKGAAAPLSPTIIQEAGIQCDPRIRVSNGYTPMETYEHMQEISQSAIVMGGNVRDDELRTILNKRAIEKIDEWAAVNLAPKIHTGEVDMVALINDGKVDVDEFVDHFCTSLNPTGSLR